MGLLSDAYHFVVDPIAETIGGTLSTATGDESYQETTDSITQTTTETISGTEDSVNDGVQETTETVEVTLDQGSEGVFEMLAGGANTLEGFFDAIGGAFEWLQDSMWIIPIQEAEDVLKVIFGGIAGLFHGIGDLVGAVRGFFTFLSGLSGVEGAAFLVGIFLVFLAGYMVVSSVGLQTFEASIVGLTGLGLVIYAAANMVGAIVLTGAGLSLLGLAILGDRATFFIFGVPITLIGSVMLYTTLFPGQYLATFILTAGTMSGVIYGTEYLENRLGPRVGSDRPLLVGGE